VYNLGLLRRPGPNTDGSDARQQGHRPTFAIWRPEGPRLLEIRIDGWPLFCFFAVEI